MNIPQGYKSSPLGIIPKDWEVKRLGEIGNVCMCKRIMKNETNSQQGIPFYKIGTFGSIADSFISEEIYRKYKEKYPFPKTGDVLLSAAGTIGKVVVYDGKPAYFQDSNIVWINNDEGEVLNCFLKYIYSTITWKTDNGGVVLRLYNESIRSQQIVIPSSLAEQQKIVELLGTWDRAIEMQKQLIDKLELRKKGLMQQLLTGKKRLPGFTGEWKKKLVKDVCDINTGKSNSQDQVPDGQYPFYIRSATPVKSNRYLYDCEAVITIGDGQVGKVFHYVNGKFDLHQRCYMMSNFKDVHPPYFYYFFSENFYDRVMRLTAKATVDSVRLEMISDMPIFLPSLAEQKKIADYLSSLDYEIQKMTEKRDKYIEEKQGLMQVLLTGKKRI